MGLRASVIQRESLSGLCWRFVGHRCNRTTRRIEGETVLSGRRFLSTTRSSLRTDANLRSDSTRRDQPSRGKGRRPRRPSGDRFGIDGGTSRSAARVVREEWTVAGSRSSLSCLHPLDRRASRPIAGCLGRESACEGHDRRTVFGPRLLSWRETTLGETVAVGAGDACALHHRGPWSAAKPAL